MPKNWEGGGAWTVCRFKGGGGGRLGKKERGGAFGTFTEVLKLMMSYLPKVNVLTKATNNHIAVFRFAAYLFFNT